MKKITLFAVFSFISLCGMAFSEEENEAENILANSSPFAVGAEVLMQRDGKQITLYNKQLHAIESLSVEQISKGGAGFIGLLVGYLNYSKMPVAASSAPMPPPELKRVKEVFPVYALLVDAPNLDSALLNYCENLKIDNNLRLAALAILRQRNRSIFNSARLLIEKEQWSQSTEVKAYLQFLSSDEAFFWGIPKKAAK